jgi:hypothetical protein
LPNPHLIFQSFFGTFQGEEFIVQPLERVATIRGRSKHLFSVLLAIMAGLIVPLSQASVTVLLSEPFGSFGTMMPLGHVGVYLDHVCADSAVHLRLCRPGEMGIVLSRYHRVANIDWLAIPIMPFLYGVDDPDQVPQFMTLPEAAAIRERYRLRYLRDIVPDGPNGGPAPKGEWVETIGVTFDRRVWGYRIETTVDQDQRLIDVLNDRPNVRAYRLRTDNCADFAAKMVNILYPDLVRRNKVYDFGLMTPKQVARSVAAYGESHPEAKLSIMEIPQIPGTLGRSRPIWGVAESGLKTKRYFFTLSVIQPEVIIGCGIVYLQKGSWQVGKGATPVKPGIWVAPEKPETQSNESVAGGGAPAANTNTNRSGSTGTSLSNP